MNRDIRRERREHQPNLITLREQSSKLCGTDKQWSEVRKQALNSRPQRLRAAEGDDDIRRAADVTAD